MKQKYQKPQAIIVATACQCQILAGSGDEKGVVKPGQGEGKTEDGDDYIVLSKHHNAWSTWDNE